MLQIPGSSYVMESLSANFLLLLSQLRGQQLQLGDFPIQQNHFHAVKLQQSCKTHDALLRYLLRISREADSVHILVFTHENVVVTSVNFVGCYLCRPN